MHHFIWCSCPLYIYPSEVCIQGYKEVGTGYRAPPENYHVHSKHLGPDGVLLVQHLFPGPRSILWAKPGDSYGVSCEPCSGQFVYGVFWGQSPNNSSGTPQMVEKVCGWHICHFETRQEYINSVDPAIQFTTEEQRQDSFHALPWTFWSTLKRMEH